VKFKHREESIELGAEDRALGVRAEDGIFGHVYLCHAGSESRAVINRYESTKNRKKNLIFVLAG